MTAADILGVLLRVNLAAGAAILGVIVLRKLARKRFGARVAYGLWLAPVLASVAVLAPARQVIVHAVAPAVAVVPRVDLVLPTIGPAFSTTPRTADLDPLVLLLALWLVGVAGAAVVMVLLQRRFAREAIKGAIGPAVVGVLAPRIVTPRDFEQRYSAEEQTLVLAHEWAHIARQDSRLNGLSAVAQCLCWFNPLVHLGAHLMRIDQELACDETVVARFPDARRTYAEVLVKSQMTVLLLPLGCYWPSKGKHPLVERVAMLTLKDLSPVRRLTGAAALTLLCTGAGITAWAAQPADVRFAASPVRNGAFAPSSPGSAAYDGARKSGLASQTQDQPTAEQRPETAAAESGPAAPTSNEATATTPLDQRPPGYAPATVTPIQVQPAPPVQVATGYGPIDPLRPPPTLIQNGATRADCDAPGRCEEAFLRRYLEAQEAGQPDYSELTPRLALAARNQQSRLTSDLKTWGDLVSIQFNGGGSGGGDTYIVAFKHVRVEVLVGHPGPDGKIDTLWFGAEPDETLGVGRWGDFPGPQPRSGWQAQ